MLNLELLQLLVLQDLQVGLLSVQSAHFLQQPSHLRLVVELLDLQLVQQCRSFDLDLVHVDSLGCDESCHLLVQALDLCAQTTDDLAKRGVLVEQLGVVLERQVQLHLELVGHALGSVEEAQATEVLFLLGRPVGAQQATVVFYGTLRSHRVFAIL